MNILITGVAGFIGNNFCAKLAQSKRNYKIIGIDNINSYYSIKLKKSRIARINKIKNVKFYKLDLSNRIKLEKLFKKYKFNEVYNFAAQAGVRYSIENPDTYINSNILGFSNLISLSKKYRVKKFFFASSSSVYGDNKKFPIKEDAHLNPKSIYGITKKNNEELAEMYNINYKFKSTALRFFTVFGEWGRPDMFIIKYLIAAYKNKIFYLNNYGNHLRDFTYIEDVTTGLLKLRQKKQNGFEVFNICSNKPVSLFKVINLLKFKIPKVKTKLRSMQVADVYKTHGNNIRFIKKTGHKFSLNFEKSLYKTLEWFKKHKRIFI